AAVAALDLAPAVDAEADRAANRAVVLRAAEEGVAAARTGVGQAVIELRDPVVVVQLRPHDADAGRIADVARGGAGGPVERPEDTAVIAHVHLAARGEVRREDDRVLVGMGEGPRARARPPERRQRPGGTAVVGAEQIDAAGPH